MKLMAELTDVNLSFLRIPYLLRRLKFGIWRRGFSIPMRIIFGTFYGIDFKGSAMFVGWPVFKGENISFGKNCFLGSHPLINSIGLFRPCIFETMADENGLIGKISIGDNFGASGVCIVAQSSVFIGNNVMVGANVTILDTDFHSLDAVQRRNFSTSGAKTKPIVIEDDVWLGMNAVILKGVRIGRGAVIGANCVVTSDVPANSVAVGAGMRQFVPVHDGR